MPNRLWFIPNKAIRMFLFFFTQVVDDCAHIEIELPGVRLPNSSDFFNDRVF